MLYTLTQLQPAASELPQGAFFLLIVAIGVGTGAAILMARRTG